MGGSESRSRRAAIALATGTAVLLAGGHVDAAPGDPADDTSSTATIDPLPVPRGLTWKWQRFRAWEYPVTIGTLGTAFYVRFAGPPPKADWTGGILFDDWVQDRVSIKDTSTRQTVSTATDVFFYGSMAYRLVDSAVLPSLAWQSPDVALQMSMIDLESFGFVAITLWGSQAFFGRQRPYADHCSDPAFATAIECSASNKERNRSFYAGHPAVVLTAAGLTCMHHMHLPLYGGGAGDTVACVAMLGASVATGIGRVVTEEHHSSDLLVGYTAGAIGGFLLPWLLHYRIETATLEDAPRSASKAPVRATLMPQIGPRDLGVGLHGTF